MSLRVEEKGVILKKLPAQNIRKKKQQKVTNGKKICK